MGDVRIDVVEEQVNAALAQEYALAIARVLVEQLLGRIIIEVESRSEAVQLLDLVVVETHLAVERGQVGLVRRLKSRVGIEIGHQRLGDLRELADIATFDIELHGDVVVHDGGVAHTDFALVVHHVDRGIAVEVDDREGAGMGNGLVADIAHNGLIRLDLHIDKERVVCAIQRAENLLELCSGEPVEDRYGIDLVGAVVETAVVKRCSDGQKDGGKYYPPLANAEAQEALNETHEGVADSFQITTAVVQEFVEIDFVVVGHINRV